MAGQSSWEIKEIEGADRWSAILQGRAVPMADTPPQFGVMNKNEDTSYHGRPSLVTEPVSVSFPDLSIEGRWGVNELRASRSLIAFAPNTYDTSTPMNACKAFEAFAARNKVCEVTWSAGITRICRWDKFVFGPLAKKGPDLHWEMHFIVLGRAVPPPPKVTAMRKADVARALSSSAFGLDTALAGIPPGMLGSFASNIGSYFSTARQALAALRRAVDGVVDLATAPAQAVNALVSFGENARLTILSSIQAIDGVPFDYQVAFGRAELLGRAFTYTTNVRTAAQACMDPVLALLAYLDGRTNTVQRFLPVASGENLLRVAVRAYGPGNGARWVDIATANGLSSQIVPAGVSQLLIPAVS